MLVHRILLVSVALVAAGCATSHRAVPIVTTTEAPGEVDRSAPITVQVKSEYSGLLTVYSVSEGVATRLGEIRGSNRETFRLPGTSMPSNGIILLAVPVGGAERGTTERLVAVPGDTIDFTVGAKLASSTGGIRR
jgi:hypothetical protein